jgi:hypothetical protein
MNQKKRKVFEQVLHKIGWKLEDVHLTGTSKKNQGKKQKKR